MTKSVWIQLDSKDFELVSPILMLFWTLNGGEAGMGGGGGLTIPKRAKQKAKKAQKVSQRVKKCQKVREKKRKKSYKKRDENLRENKCQK